MMISVHETETTPPLGCLWLMFVPSWEFPKACRGKRPWRSHITRSQISVKADTLTE